MAVPRSVHLSIAVTLVFGLLALTWVSRSINKSRVSMLTVASVEKVQKLDNQIGNRLANDELAKWDKLESEIFPSDSNKKAVVSKVKSHKDIKKAAKQEKLKHHVPVRVHIKQQQQQQQEHKKIAESRPIQRKSAIFFNSGSGKVSTDVRFRGESKSISTVMPAKFHILSTAAPKHARTQKKSLEPEASPSSSLGVDVIDFPVHGGEDEGDVHVPGDSVNRYIFKANGKTLLARKPSTIARKVESPKSQKLGFLGEGPWAHVKEGDAHHPNGGGGDFFGRDSKLKKDGGVDGQGGIVVDRWMWDAAAQDHMNNGRRPPCMAACDRPEGCEGHQALTNGDCDEMFLRDQDLDKDKDKISPATYDAYSGDTHSVYKTHRVQTLHAQRRQSPSARAIGLAPLDRHLAVAHRPPGLGIFAPTAQMKQAVFEQLSTVPENQNPAEAEVHARVDYDGFRLHPSVVDALNATNGTALGDEIVDGALDVSVTPDVIEPFMYKDGAAHRSILHGAAQARRPSPLGDEVLDGLHDDKQLIRGANIRPSHSGILEDGRAPAVPVARRAAAKMNPHAMFLAAAAGEPSSDGLSDEVVPRREAATAGHSRETWETFFTPQHTRAAAAARAAKAAVLAAHAAVPRQQLVTVGENSAAVAAAHPTSATSTTTSKKCLGGEEGGNGTLCGDETVDPLAHEAVHVERDQVQHDPKEVNIYNYFTARKPTDAPLRPAFKDHLGVHHGLTDLAARQEMDDIFSSLPGGLPSSPV